MEAPVALRAKCSTAAPVVRANRIPPTPRATSGQAKACAWRARTMAQASSAAAPARIAQPIGGG